MIDITMITDIPQIKSMGVSIFDPVWSLKKHKSGGNELLYIIRGKVKLITDEYTCTASDGEVLLVPKDTFHRDEFNLEKELEVLIIQYTWDKYEDSFRELKNDVFASIQEETKNSIRRILDEMRIAHSSENHSRLDPIILNTRLLTVLLLILRASEKDNCEFHEGNNTQSASHSQLIKRAKNLIERKYSEPLSLEEIALDLGVSPYHLSRVFSSENNFSLFEYLTHIRMVKAAAMLSEKRMNVSEIAEAVGFHDGAYFSKVFKKYYGKKPSDFA